MTGTEHILGIYTALVYYNVSHHTRRKTTTAPFHTSKGKQTCTCKTISLSAGPYARSFWIKIWKAPNPFITNPPSLFSLFCVYQLLLHSTGGECKPISQSPISPVLSVQTDLTRKSQANVPKLINISVNHNTCPWLWWRHTQRLY